MEAKYDDWSQHLHKVARAEKRATELLNGRKWQDAWVEVTAIKQAAESALKWLERTQGRRASDKV